MPIFDYTDVFVEKYTDVLRFTWLEMVKKKIQHFQQEYFWFVTRKQPDQMKIKSYF